ncbi:hypothetical protein LDENG_00099660 [Lucifuga dentata]|nr:hypothetical protein LDENG_00099660 [Lucifuga dentata]
MKAEPRDARPRLDPLRVRLCCTRRSCVGLFPVCVSACRHGISLLRLLSDARLLRPFCPGSALHQPGKRCGEPPLSGADQPTQQPTELLLSFSFLLFHLHLWTPAPRCDSVLITHTQTNMETVMERECSALGGLFQTVIGDMKSSYPVWDDFISKAGKLQSQLRATVATVAAFLDAFQKVADLATNSRGGTRDIGSALTRMCMRHRSIEAKLRQFSILFLDCLINPLQEQMEEWKRVANTLDKDHAKEYKKARQEIKKRSSDTLKLQKKAKKADVFGRGDIQPQLDSAMQDISDKYLLLEETEKQAVRKVLVEERSRFCCFVSMLKPVVEEEMSMLGEITHLQTLTEDLKTLTMDPHKLPASSEQVIVDLKGSECTWSYQTPPSSPSTTVSRKSSMCSSLNSVNSSDSRSSGSHCHSPTSHFRYRTSSSSSSALPQQTPARLSSISSHDSGFISQDAFQSKSPSPMPPETLQSSQPVSEDPSSPSSSSPTHHELQQLLNGFDPHAAPCLHGMVLQAQDTHLHPPYFTSSTSTSPISSPSYFSISPGWAWPRSSSGAFTFHSPSGPGVIPSSRVPSWKV